MAITVVSDLSNSDVVKYMSRVLKYAMDTPVWQQTVNGGGEWDSVGMGGDGGTSFDYLVYEPLDVDLTALVEDTDIPITTMDDSNVTVTPKEIGKRVGTTSKARFQARANLREQFAEIVGQNQAETVDMAVRQGVLSGGFVYRPNDNTARTGLDTTNDLITWDRLNELVEFAWSQGIQPYEDETFVAVVHPLVLRAILGLTEVKEVGYRKFEPIFKGEIAQVAGIRLIRHRFGKLYLSGGTTAQAATTLNGAVSAGDTTIIVTDGTGLAAGNYITIGTLETKNTEQVQITDASATPTLTIRGRGHGASNQGLQYAHANGAAVLEAANVAAIPILGKNSVLGVYGREYGRFGKPFVNDKLDSANRLIYLGWVWYGGIGVFPKHVVRGEFAVAGGLLGDNFGV